MTSTKVIFRTSCTKTSPLLNLSIFSDSSFYFSLLEYNEGTTGYIDIDYHFCIQSFIVIYLKAPLRSTMWYFIAAYILKRDFLSTTQEFPLSKPFNMLPFPLSKFSVTFARPGQLTWLLPRVSLSAEPSHSLTIPFNHGFWSSMVAKKF